MFYYDGKRHIGEEGRANETGIPPTSLEVERTTVPTRWDDWQR